jgi:hypothetical protein
MLDVNRLDRLAGDVRQATVPNATYSFQNLESSKSCGAGLQPAAGW